MERTTSIREAFADVLDDKAWQGVRPRTIDVYRRSFERFAMDTGLEWLKGATVRPIRSWLLGHRHVSGATRRRTTAAPCNLRRVRGWALE